MRPSRRGLLGDANGKAIQDTVQNANATPATGLVATLIGVCDASFSERSLFATSFGLPANGESVQPEELENYRYDNDDTDNIKDVVTHVL